MKKLKTTNYLTILILSIISYETIANTDISISNENCEIKTPPEISGEDQSDLIAIKIFPRKKYINENYYGCQTSWIKINKKWITFSKTYIENGTGTAFIVYNGKSKIVAKCLYKNNKLFEGKPDKCPGIDSLIKSSFPSGCIEIKKLHGKLPVECKFE